jgi:deoxyribodipyrimidine photolyase-related protein
VEIKLAGSKILQRKMPEKQKYRELRLILGDQLNSQHSWIKNVEPDVLYVLMEIRAESQYVTHHIQKIAGIFLAMRSFAEMLIHNGHRVFYFSISDTQNRHSFEENLQMLTHQFSIEKIRFLEPDEWRLDALLKETLNKLQLPFSIDSTEHFLTERNELAELFKGKKGYLMETFYRSMRKKHGVLIDGTTEPASGKWNYDHDNRNKLPKNHRPPEPLLFKHDISELLNEITSAQLPSIGKIDAKNFSWPKNREESLEVLSYFIDYLLPQFGTFQDALSDDYWSLYHSRLSFALNVKMIHPLEVIQAAEQSWRQNPNRVSLAQAEGFIRQILGWREYMRGIYWAQMPQYAELNFFGHNRPLPQFFWTAKTNMRCLNRAIGQSLDYAYAHHIQRLMVTGNFALLTGIHPDEVDKWYLGIYIDAFEWVEITNTRGMSQFADGGIVGTKPYVSSAAYLHKMGNHCENCQYDYKITTGPKACPFNSLYWNFLNTNRTLLEKNPRMTMMYRVWDKFGLDKKADVLKQADIYLNQLEDL